jgi:hypothetical protein
VIGVVVQIPKELPVVFQPVGKLRRHGAKSGHWHLLSPSPGIPKPGSRRCPPSQTMTETDCFMVATNLHALALLVQHTFPPDLRPSPTAPNPTSQAPSQRAPFYYSLFSIANSPRPLPTNQPQRGAM